MEIVFWQRIVSIHQAPLVVALALEPGVKVTYVAEEVIPDGRKALGWLPPTLGCAKLVLVSSAKAVAELIPHFSANTIHICQGFRDNGLVGVAQISLGKRHSRVLVHVETVYDCGLSGFIKRFWYRLIIHRAVAWVDAVLAIGERTPKWFVNRGFPAPRVFPYSYFLNLPSATNTDRSVLSSASPFRIVFIGNFIERKRLDLLLKSLVQLGQQIHFELMIAGSGPLENKLRRLAYELLGERVVWKGLLPSAEVSQFLSGADCLVLPSWHDGWGAVVSEALLVGTPVICSDRCGASVAVRQSRAGGIFRSGDLDSLTACLLGVMRRGLGRTPDRAHLAAWAQNSLSASAGARHLIEILRHRFAGAKRPLAPFLNPRF